MVDPNYTYDMSDAYPNVCEKCCEIGALCEYHLREELAGTRGANEDLHKRIRELESLFDTIEGLEERIRDRDKRIRELDKYVAAFFRIGAEIAKSGCCDHLTDDGHINNCTREHLMVTFLQERRKIEGE